MLIVHPESDRDGICTYMPHTCNFFITVDYFLAKFSLCPISCPVNCTEGEGEESLSFKTVTY